MEPVAPAGAPPPPEVDVAEEPERVVARLKGLKVGAASLLAHFPQDAGALAEVPDKDVRHLTTAQKSARTREINRRKRAAEPPGALIAKAAVRPVSPRFADASDV